MLMQSRQENSIQCVRFSKPAYRGICGTCMHLEGTLQSSRTQGPFVIAGPRKCGCGCTNLTVHPAGSDHLEKLCLSFLRSFCSILFLPGCPLACGRPTTTFLPNIGNELMPHSVVRFLCSLQMICKKKSNDIGCVIPPRKSQRGITQPIPRLFYHQCMSEKQLISLSVSLFVGFPFALRRGRSSPNAITEL